MSFSEWIQDLQKCPIFDTTQTPSTEAVSAAAEEDIISPPPISDMLDDEVFFDDVPDCVRDYFSWP